MRLLVYNGTLPDSSTILESDPAGHWIKYRTADGSIRLRFRADEAFTLLRWQELKGDGYWARRRGNLDEAEGFYRAALDELAKDEKWLLERLTTLNTLADLCNEKGDREQAIQIARSILSQRRSIASNDDIRLGGDLMFLAMSLARQGEYSEAVELAEEGVRIYRAVFGDEHSETQRMNTFLDLTRENLASQPAAR